MADKVPSPIRGARVAIFAPACCLLLGCSAFNRITVVDTPPANCILLEELSFHRACDYDGQVFQEDVKDFKRLARKIGADTIECCRIADEEVVLLLVNRRTGQSCAGARQRFAGAYRCGDGGKP